MTPDDSQASSRSRTEAPAQLLTRQRLLVWAGILSVTAVSWFVLVRMPMPSGGIGAESMNGMAMSGAASKWQLRDAAMIFAMWTVMMAAMMLPSTLPMIEMHARISRGQSAEAAGHAPLFAAGYLLAWTCFAAAMTLVQYQLDRMAIIGDTMRMGAFAGGLLLIATGIYQVTPLKQACLTKCRTPLGFFMTRWHTGARGALLMGFNHGVFCVGCCWMLMALMFVGGAMNLAWAAALTIFVLLEKAAPWGGALSRASGAVMLASGLALVILG
jgi:predicted metal-binding membrane protein